MEGEGELSSEETGGGGSGGGRGEVEVGGFELFDEVGEGSEEGREESGKGREGGKGGASEQAMSFENDEKEAKER